MWKLAHIFQEQATHWVHHAAVVLMSNAGERLLTKQMDESQEAISETLGLHLIELNFKSCGSHA